MTIMNLEEYKGVYVFAQQVDNELSSIAFELLGKAKELAAPLNTDVTAVLIGSDVKGLVDQLAEYGADKVIVVDDPELKEYRTEPYAHALASVINEYKPEIVLVGATAIGRDLGPRVSARVATGLTADCTVLEIGDFPLNAIPGQEQKNAANAPEYAAYILIEGEADGLHVVYRIYLGENNTSDFNIARNRVYRIEARILGRNTVDWRVSTTEVSVTPFAERHAPGRTATAQLRVVGTNNDRSTCVLTCEREEGDGDVTLDGEPILFGVPYPFLSGDGERIAEIAYTQQREGDVRLRLVLTDETGLHAERVLQTSYVREPLRVSFTQDKFELAALDRARVNFTVEQDDYDGTYTVQVEGTPTLFRNLTDDIGPVTGYTVAGNGTYPLRIRPEAVGENPYRITVTDEKGNSAFFDSFVTGIKTVSCFTCSFSKISGGIEVVAEGTYPVMNDLTITLNPTVTVVLRGGATKTLTCTMNVKIEADRMRGRASATLDLGTGYTDYSVTDYEATFSRTASENGMVEYAVQ